MFLDSIHGIIARRILLNYRVDPDALKRVLPPPFQPKIFKGYGIAGVCMIRFKELRPKFVPSWLGLGSENAAHRIAVQWQQDDQLQEGVYIPRRDTNSWFNKSFGGRVFPGIFHHSQFEGSESQNKLALRILGAENKTKIEFAGHLAEELPSTSLFSTLEEASSFFALGSTGYSATHSEGHFHGMELHSTDWKIAPLDIETAKSCLFDDPNQFPAGTAELDCALLMRNVKHEWHSRPDLYSSLDLQTLTTHRHVR